MIQINEEDFGTLAICAIRYCQGRETYMPGLVRGILLPFLKEISDKDLQVMLNDCDYQERFNLYGNDSFDKPRWLEWRTTLLNEQQRRKS